LELGAFPPIPSPSPLESNILMAASDCQGPTGKKIKIKFLKEMNGPRILATVVGQEMTGGSQLMRLVKKNFPALFVIRTILEP
jgi:hypothetical protein